MDEPSEAKLMLSRSSTACTRLAIASAFVRLWGVKSASSRADASKHVRPAGRTNKKASRFWRKAPGGDQPWQLWDGYID